MAPVRAVPQDALPEGRRRPPRPRLRWTVLGLAVVLVGLAGASVVPALRTRDQLEAGQALLGRARDRLLEGDVAEAKALFGSAKEDFVRASGAATVPLVRLWASVPLVGRSYDALRDLARIGELASAAGEDLTAAVGNLPGGLSALAPSAGSIRLQAVGTLKPAVASAATRLRLAASLAEGLANVFVLPALAGAGDMARDRLDEASRTALAIDAILRALPEFVGVDRPRRYFVAMQNPAELRGTGGFIGSYSLLTIDDGRLSLAPFRSITTLPDAAPGVMPTPSRQFGHLYDEFGGVGFWRNINMSPDTPTVGAAIEALYRHIEGMSLDGTIFVDPAVLAYMVQATGPITEAQTGITLSADEVVPFMTNGAYESFPGTARKRVLGEAAATILGRFLQGTDPVAALRALASAAGEGHLVVHAADPAVERAFAAAGIDGSIGAGGGDYLAIFLTNAAGNKVDYYLEPRLSYHVILGADGTASAEASVGLANGAPAGQQPSEVLGPYGSIGLEPGDTQWWVETFCAPGCLLQQATEDGGPGSVQPLRERGLPMFRSFVRANAGETSTLGYRFNNPNAWRGDDAGGTYELTLQAQPTIRPVRAEIAIRAPDGMGVVATSAPMRVRGGLALWRGTVEGKMTLWVKFERPILGRIWARLWSLLPNR
jgi:Protein of unknown function (DUF4012)